MRVFEEWSRAAGRVELIDGYYDGLFWTDEHNSQEAMAYVFVLFFF